MSEHVNVNCFVSCDRVITEAETGKKSVIGVFKNFNFKGLPSRFPAPWFIFAQLANVDAGQHNITINIVHDETQGVVFAASLEVAEDHPEDIELVMPAQGTEFSKEGKFVVSMNMNGSQIAYNVITVNLKTQQIGG